MLISNNKKYIFQMLIIVTFFTTSSLADTLHLKDGTLLVGKVKSKSSKTVIFKNTYGEFKIKRKSIKKIYLTKSYKKDIAIQKKLGKEVNEEAIKKDFLAGSGKRVEEKESVEPATKLKSRRDNKTDISSNRYNNRLTLSGTRLQSMGDLKSILPTGYGGFAAYDYGDSERYFLIPYLRLEGGYVYFKKNEVSMMGPVWSAGLSWLFPFINKSYGSIIISVSAGMSHLEFANGSQKGKSNTFSAWGSAGYEFPFSTVILQLQTRYMFVADRQISIYGLGGLFGVGFNF